MSLCLALGLATSNAIAAPDQEVVPPDEAKDTAIVIKGLEAFVNGEHPALRDAHAKGHGCVRGEFTVNANLPDKLRHGIFAEPHAYKAWIRFSNSSGTPQSDGIGDARGMAIKLVDVPGPKLLPGAADARIQDFVMFSYPAFFIKNAADYVAFLQLTAQHKQQQFFAERPHQAAVFKAASAHALNLLDLRYYSVTPYLLGDTITKFSTNPVDCASGAKLVPETGEPPKDRPDFLTQRLAKWLGDKDACFIFAVQPQTNPATQPVEDPTVEWKQSEAPFIDVAAIRIPKQTFDTPAQQAFCENLSFSPWHADVAERPLGAINRMRKPVYRAISDLRHKLDGTPNVEPSGTETFR